MSVSWCFPQPGGVFLSLSAVRQTQMFLKKTPLILKWETFSSILSHSLPYELTLLST